MNARFDVPQHRMLNQALNCLLRFGENLSIMCSRPGEKEHVMRLSSMSIGQSAFGAALFYPDFFDSYAMDIRKKRIDLQLPLRNLQSALALKNAQNKHLQSCEMAITENTECRLSIRLHGTQGTSRTHKLTYESAPCLFPRDSPGAVNHIIASPKTIQALLDFFANKKGGEITMTCTSRGCSLSTSANESLDMKQRQTLQTEVHVAKESFLTYTIGQEVEMTFTLQEFRAPVSLADHLQVNLEMHFESAGYPLNVLVKSEGMHVQVFLATSEPNVPRLQNRNRTTVSESNQSVQPVQTNELISRQQNVFPNELVEIMNQLPPIESFGLPDQQNGKNQAETEERNSIRNDTDLFRHMDDESEQGSQVRIVPLNLNAAQDETIDRNHQIYPLESTQFPSLVEMDLNSTLQDSEQNPNVLEVRHQQTYPFESTQLPPPVEMDLNSTLQDSEKNPKALEVREEKCESEQQEDVTKLNDSKESSLWQDKVLATFEEECAKYSNDHDVDNNNGQEDDSATASEDEVPMTQGNNESNKRQKYSPLI